jgi:uncharacterized secreted protein with C-terminal beta-propeller domain
VALIDTSEAKSTPAASYSYSSSVVDMMISGDTLIAFVTDYAAREVEISGGDYQSIPIDAKETRAILYDISDPSHPEYVTSMGQSGTYRTSRLLDGVLFTVTDYTVTDGDAIDESDPGTFVPVTTLPASRTPIPADCVTVVPGVDYPRYSVVTAIDVAGRQRLGEQSVLGGSDTVYMGQDNLYLAGTRWVENLSEADKKKLGSPVDSGAITPVVRVALNGGKLKVAAQASVPGSLVNQFAMDESAGHLRVAVNIDGTEDNDWQPIAALYVFDSGLKQTGSVTLVKNETIQSVRFQGAVGYVVTFRQTDPLFSIDLSNPAKPKVMDKLKIPGFSTYMHPWGEGQLVGLGWDGDENGTTGAMKLSLFDVSNPYDISEVKSLKVDYYESEALYDHRAVFADPENGLIGFPVYAWNSSSSTPRYLVYEYDAKANAFSVTPVDLSIVNGADTYGYGFQTRGFRIGNDLYVCTTDGVAAYSLDGFERTATVLFR